VGARAAELHGVTDLQRLEPAHHRARGAVPHHVDLHGARRGVRRAHGVHPGGRLETVVEVEPQRRVRSLPERLGGEAGDAEHDPDEVRGDVVQLVHRGGAQHEAAVVVVGLDRGGAVQRGLGSHGFS
jgi:hypothetical protein